MFLYIPHISDIILSVPFTWIHFNQHNAFHKYLCISKLHDFTFNFGQRVFHCVYVLYRFFIQTFVHGSWVVSRVFAIVNSVTMNIGMKRTFLYCVGFGCFIFIVFLGYILRSRELPILKTPICPAHP